MISTEGVGISGLFTSQGLDHLGSLIVPSAKADAFQAKCSQAPMAQNGQSLTRVRGHLFLRSPPLLCCPAKTWGSGRPGQCWSSFLKWKMEGTWGYYDNREIGDMPSLLFEAIKDAPSLRQSPSFSCCLRRSCVQAFQAKLESLSHAAATKPNVWFKTNKDY